MRNISDKSYRKNKKNIIFPLIFSRRRAVYDITWKKWVRVGQATDDVAKEDSTSMKTLRPYSSWTTWA
jgi:hypothetical protein